jgi:cardiolipin synthase
MIHKKIKTPGAPIVGAPFNILKYSFQKNIAVQLLSLNNNPTPLYTTLRQFISEHFSTIVLIGTIIISVFTIIRIIIDTRNTAKTMLYIILVLLFPIGGTIFYFAFGINYRKHKMFSKKIISNEDLSNAIERRIEKDAYSMMATQHEAIKGNEDVIKLLLKDAQAALTNNKVTVLRNGEEKFAALLAALNKAQKFIHLEYYIFEDDNIGNTIIDILIARALEGVTVRFIYDDFGSHGLSNAAINRMQAVGIQIHPFLKIHFFLLANRLNYRNHRKICIIDGTLGFIGGINVSDKYINTSNTQALYWRDTHLLLEGNAVLSLQYHFIANWNFCADDTLEPNTHYFPFDTRTIEDDVQPVQIVAGGPDYLRSSIMLTFFTAIVNAKERIYITTPYFIPNSSINDALKKAALSGKDVQLLVPGISDSYLVNAATRSYFYDLLECGVRIFLYQKGFIHAKTMLVDDNFSMVGTANLDARSFDLNFEINAVVYGNDTCTTLAEQFILDCEDSEEIDFYAWANRSWWRELIDDTARLLSPLL